LALLDVREAAARGCGAARALDLTALRNTHRVRPTAAGQPHETYANPEPSHWRAE
jgi:hypothetical protein